MTIKQQIKLAVQKIKTKILAKKVFLFGSQANGKSVEGSDIDLCVVADIKGKRKIDIIREIRREILSIITYSLDILVYDEKEFSRRSKLKNTLEYNINRDGIKLYG